MQPVSEVEQPWWHWNGGTAVSPNLFLALRLPNACMPQLKSLAAFSPLSFVQHLCEESDRQGISMRRKNVTVLWAALAGPNGLPHRLDEDQGRAACRVFDTAAAANAPTDIGALSSEVPEGCALVAFRVAYQLADVPLADSSDEQTYMKRSLRALNAGIADDSSDLLKGLRPRTQLLMHSCELQSDPLADDDRKVAERRYNQRIAGLRDERRTAHQELVTSLSALQRLQRDIVAAVREGGDWTALAPLYREQEAAVIKQARRDALATHSISTAEQKVTSESLHVERAGGSAPAANQPIDLVRLASPADGVRRRWRNGVLPSAQVKRLKAIEKEVYVPACRHIHGMIQRAEGADIPCTPPPPCSPPLAQFDPDFGELVTAVRVKR
eukprot:TRINITY_DN12291_c0_g1_i1.p1 TRINITY_DN12291_c0_g1~~TRINITY_DN12291_c0_g1_i1.p1  ORF type:complete len:384 (+),score=103.01 TRINITY_DN12291_c0_g1_i1:66-1217(+)